MQTETTVGIAEEVFLTNDYSCIRYMLKDKELLAEYTKNVMGEYVSQHVCEACGQMIHPTKDIPGPSTN